MMQPVGSAIDLEPGVSRVEAEIVMGRYRVTGELRFPGPPRRFVDAMNTLETSFAVAFDARIEEAYGEGEGHRFHVVQLQPEAILFAMKRSGEDPPPSGLDAVHKVPVRCKLILPGFEITGKMWQVPDADPRQVAVTGKRRFAPVTEAVIVSSYGARPWNEPLVAVNLLRTLVYAPHPA